MIPAFSIAAPILIFVGSNVAAALVRVVLVPSVGLGILTPSEGAAVAGALAIGAQFCVFNRILKA